MGFIYSLRRFINWSMIDELLKRSISWYRCRSFPLFDCTLPYRFIPQKVPIATRSYHFVSFACILEHTACSSCTLKVNTIALCLRRSNCVKLRNHRFAPRFSAFSLTPGILWRRHIYLRCHSADLCYRYRGLLASALDHPLCWIRL